MKENTSGVEVLLLLKCLSIEKEIKALERINSYESLSLIADNLEAQRLIFSLTNKSAEMTCSEWRISMNEKKENIENFKIKK